MLRAAGSSVSAGEISLCTCALPNPNLIPTFIKNRMVSTWEALPNLLISSAVQCINLYRAIPAATQESLWSLTKRLPSLSSHTQDYSPFTKSVGIFPAHKQRL